MIFDFKYYLFATYRRKQIDKDLCSAKKYFRGKVLDAGGGMSRGKFVRWPEFQWVICDINPNLHPDIVAPVEKMPFPNECFDTVKATELFGYVEDWEKGFEDCVRVLKSKGHFVISVPFLTPVDIEQCDSQRISEFLIRKAAKNNNLKIIVFKIEGYFFSVMTDLLKSYFQVLPIVLRHITYLFFPLFDLLVFIEKFNFIRNSRFFKRFPNGYFAVFQK